MNRNSLNPDTVERAQGLRRDSTRADTLLWRALREGMPHEKWRRRVAIGPYFPAFAAHRARLVIEVGGSQHADASDADAARSSFLQAQGYRALCFSIDDVLRNLDGVIAAVRAALPSSHAGDGGSENRTRGSAADAASHDNSSPQPSPTVGEGDLINPPIGVR
jgi:very-short-patch-repair endonuclease